jgi:hypothetical protein
MSKVIRLVQFHTNHTDTGGEGEYCRVGDMKYLSDENDTYEYYLGDDDDGDSMYDELESISFSDSLDDIRRDRYLSYVPINKMDYVTITIELEEA